MIRKFTRRKKRLRKEANFDAVMEIYDRARQRGSADYLTVNQESDPATVEKIKAQAQERRNRRNAKLVQTRAVSKPNRQQNRGNLLTGANVNGKARSGKVRGFARRLIREIGQRTDRRTSDRDARSEEASAAKETRAA